MQYFSTLFLVTIISSAAFAEPPLKEVVNAPEKKTPVAQRREPKLPFACPSEWAGNPEPVLMVSQPGMPTLLVCSERDFDHLKNDAGKVELSMFKILTKTSVLAKPEILFDSKNENENYRIIPIEHGVQVSELYEFNSNRIPLLSFPVRCSSAGCRRGKKVCVIPERAKNPFPKALAEWRKRIDTADGTAVSGETPFDELVDQLFEQALTGDLKSFRAFDRGDTAEKLPRDAKKIFLSHQRALKRAKQGGCFQSVSG